MLKHHWSSPNLPKRAVVLGASGFVGKELIRHLAAQGVETLPLSSAQVDLSEPSSVDALKQTVREDDALVFVSALTPDRGRDVRTFMRNVAMGAHVSAFFEQARCAHVVYISSDAVYPDSASLVNEATQPSPDGFHGLMHLAREKMLAHTAQKSGVPYLILRSSLLYGVGDTHNSYGPNRFMRAAKKDGKISLFGNGEEKRDHIYIRDVSQLIGICLSRRSEGMLNVATGKSVSFFDVAQRIVELAGGVVIENLPRGGPVTHRHFDTAESIKSFPTFQYTPLPAGLAEAWKELAGA